MFRVARLIVVLLGFAGAAFASQAPEFAQQYRQRLNGALNELAAVVARFDRDARAEGLSVEDALRTYETVPSTFLNRRGASVRFDRDRLERLSFHADNLEQIEPLWRPLLIAREADGDLLTGTLRQYEPAIPLGAAGAAYGGIGFLAGGILGAAMVGAARRVRVRRKAVRTA